MAEHHGGNDLRDRPTSELLKQLSDQTTSLVRQEIELAKLEVREKGKKAGGRRDVRRLRACSGCTRSGP